MTIKNTEKSLDDKINEEFDLSDRTQNTDLHRMEKLISSITNESFPFSVVHVAGTNGKGSVSNFIYDVLNQSGVSVGISSDLVSISEYNHNIRVNGSEITDEEYLRIARDILSKAEVKPSEYELRIAVAAMYFTEQNIEYAIIESGIGGQYDATNVLRDDVSIITTVGLDHSEILGDTREEIAERKAGIIDPDAKVITSIEGKIRSVIQSVTEQRNAELVENDPEVVYHINEDGIRYDIGYNNKITETNIVANYQKQNITTAITAIEAIDEKINTETVLETISEFTLPGRMEIMDTNDSPKVLIDGGHNPLASQAIADTLSRIDTKITLIFASLKHLEWEEMISILEQEVDRVVITTGLKQRNDESPKEIESVISDAISETTPELDGAVSNTLRTVSNDDLVVVTGYLGFAGDCRCVLTQEENE